MTLNYQVAVAARIAMTIPATHWPLQSDVAAMRKLYGTPDKNGDGAPDSSWTSTYLTEIIPPYAMFYNGKPVGKITVNRMCSGALLAALNGVKAHYGTAAAIAKVGLDQFGGLYNFRVKRANPDSLSMHAYACAIDIDPLHNPFQSTKFRMPAAAVQIFKDQGAAWGGDWSPNSRDAMHFQFARVK